ncbi:MAG TPA: PspC domain-containing protein [Levilinea sp.]|nr:PspC domain-containing protein [Levilinea sp.]
MKNQRLYRSIDERMFAGVCGGLGKFFGLDPTIVRLVFVILALMGGPGILIYIVMWVVVPDEPAGSVPPPGSSGPIDSSF